ncbi:VanZ family protein [Parvularcula dongshanensis]|uniref:VanZ family protein n=1 Tax=Parvularcula dongshanensis TaxID=1173995 RepID=A0A840I1V7_9PROT|nr:VanZ family protein [Parvularcula dongshanensis]MBB4658224.1 VanZ family protein [Parvularcula dongshanensis]
MTPLSAETRRRARLTLRAATFALAAIVLVLSLMPDPTEATGGTDPGVLISRFLFGTAAYGDKVNHFITYGGLSVVASLAFGRHRDAAALTLGALLLYGGVIEVLQAMGGVRQGDLLDLTANALGILAGGGAAAALRTLLPQYRLS